MWKRLLGSALEAQQSKIREVTRLVERSGAVNLGQGTCAIAPDPRVIEAGLRAIAAGRNSYTYYDGVPELKENIARRYAVYNGMAVKSSNILVTCGATGAFESICKSFLGPGDEVILLEPSYQYHVRQVQERWATPRFVRLRVPGWRLDPGELESAITARTKLLVMSNPNNPTGKVFSKEELQEIGQICAAHDVIVVNDEVYEHILSVGKQHTSMASLPDMFPNCLTVSSASKTLFVTGWRVGWAIGPEEVIKVLGIKSDETYVCAPAPLQYAVADCLAFGDSFFEKIRIPFQERCRQLCAALSEAKFTPLAPEGAYYVLAGYEELGYRSDDEAMYGLIENVGVAAVPGKAFFPSMENTGMLRFCFAVDNDALDKACEGLKKIMRRARTQAAPGVP